MAPLQRLPTLVPNPSPCPRAHTFAHPGGLLRRLGCQSDLSSKAFQHPCCVIVKQPPTLLDCCRTLWALGTLKIHLTFLFLKGPAQALPDSTFQTPVLPPPLCPLTLVASSDGTLLRLAANSDLSSKAFHTAAVTVGGHCSKDGDRRMLVPRMDMPP